MSSNDVSRMESDIVQNLYRFDQPVSRRIAALEQVTEADIQSFRNEGYLIIDKILTDKEIADAKREIADIIHGRIQGPQVQFVKELNERSTDEDKENAVRKINRYSKFADALGKINNHAGILQLLERLFREQPKAILDQALLKPPFGGGEKPWHQDMAYGNQKYTKQTITVWMALDEAGTDNGCMHIIPKSHMNGGVPHYQIRDWQICDSSVDTNRDYVVPLKPGGALFFSGLLHHGTPVNSSAKRRWALQLRFAPASAVLMNAEEFKLMFTNEMTEADC